MVSVLGTIINSIPAPIIQKGDLQFQVSLIDYDDYLEQIGIGRITRDSIHVGGTVSLVKLDGSIECFRVAQLFNNYNLKRIKVESALSGDIVAITGCNNLYVGETISSLKKPEALIIIKIHEPTMKLTFLINDSPFAGHERSILTMRKIEERLKYGVRKDVALKMLDTNSPNMWIICGRGELHFSILIEKMRREGYEFQVTRPIGIEKGIDCTIYEPHDKVEIKIPTEFVGKTIESLISRYGQLIGREPHVDTVKLEFIIPTKGLIGYNTKFMSITKGYGEKTQ